MKPRYPGILSIVLGLMAAAVLLTPAGVNAHGNASGTAGGKAVFPNPFTEGTTFELTMPRSSEIKIDVYNLRGHHIRNLFGGEEGMEHPAGVYKVQWDGKDKFGLPVLPGVYICVLQTSDGTVIKSVKAIKLEK